MSRDNLTAAELMLLALALGVDPERLWAEMQAREGV